jgi:GntR family transcriptional repressor for pyruvate dehydrogenase complex
MERQLSQGQHLPSEIKLAEIFRVSRSSIREALQTLEVMGIVNRRKLGGTIIRQIAIEDWADIAI